MIDLYKLQSTLKTKKNDKILMKFKYEQVLSFEETYCRIQNLFSVFRNMTWWNTGNHQKYGNPTKIPETPLKMPKLLTLLALKSLKLCCYMIFYFSFMNLESKMATGKDKQHSYRFKNNIKYCNRGSHFMIFGVEIRSHSPHKIICFLPYLTGKFPRGDGKLISKLNNLI